MSLDCWVMLTPERSWSSWLKLLSNYSEVYDHILGWNHYLQCCLVSNCGQLIRQCDTHLIVLSDFGEVFEYILACDHDLQCCSDGNWIVFIIFRRICNSLRLFFFSFRSKLSHFFSSKIKINSGVRTTTFWSRTSRFESLLFRIFYDSTDIFTVQIVITPPPSYP